MTKTTKKKAADDFGVFPAGTSAASAEDFSYDIDFDDDCDADVPAAGSAEETARYISDMVGSLALLASEAKLDLLNYLLEMARVEAEMQARQTETIFDDD